MLLHRAGLSASAGLSCYFRNDDPYRHKTQHMSCTWSSGICVQNFAVIREEIGHRQNKQTLIYLVDDDYSWNLRDM